MSSEPAQQQAWQQFIDLYTRLIFSWARRVGLRAQDAADLVQDVFTLLVQKLPQFTYDRNKTFRGWLRTLTLNKCYENHRKRTLSMQAGNPVQLDELPGPDEAAALWEADYQQHLLRQVLELMQAHFQPSTWKAFWELDTDLVALSACETALGPDGGGEGLLGFAQVLLGRGARSLLLSLWKVDDTATALLMLRFYQNLLGQREGLKKPLDRAEALRETKR